MMDLHDSKYNMYHDIQSTFFYSCEKLPCWGQLLHTVRQWGGPVARHTRVVPIRGSRDPVKLLNLSMLASK